MATIDTTGECLYCRDGEERKLYSFTRATYHAGDVIPETEFVCLNCYNWLTKAEN